jgi:hypothetical protein
MTELSIRRRSNTDFIAEPGIVCAKGQLCRAPAPLSATRGENQRHKAAVAWSQACSDYGAAWGPRPGLRATSLLEAEEERGL